MGQILSDVIDNKYKHQNFFEQVTELLENPTPDFIERIQYKASFEFISLLDKFILYMENNYFKATDIKLTKYITIPAEFINEQFKRFHRYPIRQRFETMTDYILEMMQLQYNLTVSTPEKNQLKKEIKRCSREITISKSIKTFLNGSEDRRCSRHAKTAYWSMRT